jgi:DNA-binding response OmpR family regulator/EAL domain-containing protein (putative c-di-GMP-specific phosphodiesterase class I)
LNPTALPKTIIATLGRWQALRKSGWALDLARRVHSEMGTAITAAAGSDREPLARALQELAMYLASLVDGEIAQPTAAQWQRLGQLERSILAILQTERNASAGDARKVLLVLAPESPIWQDLVAQLSGGSVRVEHHRDAATLLARLDPAQLAAVLIDQDHLMDLGSVADRLEGSRKAESLGASIIYFNRSRDPEARALALTSGADASLEGEDSAFLLARIGELVDIRDGQASYKVLVVDDDRSQALYCASILGKQGIEVHTETDPLRAIEVLERTRPDLLLLDLNMPGVDGTELTARIRDRPEFALLPIVILTGEQDDTRRYDALRAGGDDYLLKPIRPRHLVTAVVTRARRSRALQGQLAGRQSQSVGGRLLHPGELASLLRTLGEEAPRQASLVLVAADNGRLRKADAHAAMELENQYRLAQELRAGLNPPELIAPWTGAGFMCLLACSPEESQSRAEDLRSRLESAMTPLDTGSSAASAALVALPSEALPSADALIDLAESTLAVARHGGGRKVRAALTGVGDDLPKELSLAIQKALAEEAGEASLVLRFQPIVPLHGAARPQYHAHLLLRAGGGDRLVTRRQWLAVARRTGDIGKLDRHALTEVTGQLLEARKRLPGLRIFLAVDGETLADPAFSAVLIEDLARRGLNDAGLVLSIDQSEAILLERRLKPICEALRAARIDLCLGRVGSDHRGAHTLGVLKPAVLAIEAATLASAGEGQGVLDLAQQYGAEIVAHFIPDARTLSKLFAIGVDYGMGSFIGPPSPRLDYDFG